MLFVRRLSLFVVLILAANQSEAASPRVSEAAKQRASRTLSGSSFMFEKNAGQFAADVDFVSRGDGQFLLVNGRGARIAMDPGGPSPNVIGLTFEGSRRDVQPAGGAVASYSNYFFGADRSKWVSGVPSFRSVRYAEVYPGIDLEYHARRGELEYDFIVSPGADWRSISIAFDGAVPRIDASGDLVLKAGEREIRHRAPVVWQERAGKRKEIRSRYEIAGNRVRFALGKYDRSRPLVIDPVLDFSRNVFPLVRYETFPGRLQVDASGNIYYSADVWGPTVKAVFAHQNGVAPNVVASKWDILVAKFNPDATQLLWSTYIGGGEAEFVNGMAIDANADIYIVAQCGSSDFPTTAGVLGEYAKPSIGGRASVTKIDGTTGTLEYSTYIEDRRQGSGVHAQATAVAVDGQGNAIVIGSANAPTFPTTANAFYTTFTGFGGFLSKLSPDGTSLVFSTYLPYTNPTTVALAADGSIFAGGPLLAGETDEFHATSGTTPGVYQPEYIVGRFGWIMKFSPLGTRLFSTYYPMVSEMQVDSQGNLVTVAHAITQMPTFPSSYQKTPSDSGASDIWIGKLSPDGTTLLASTFYGGFKSEPFTVEMDLGPNNSVYILGYTQSTDLPVVSAIQSAPSGTVGDSFREGFLAKFDTNLSTLMFSTYFGHVSLLGGLTVDSAGNPIFSGDRNPWPRGAQPFQATVPRFFRPDGPFIARINMSGSAALALDSVNPPTTPLTTEVPDSFVVLRGSGFLNGVTVKFDTTMGTELQLFGGGTEIWVKPPPHAAGKVNVTVTNPGGVTATITDGYEYGVPYAVIQTATPSTVNSLGETVTFTGTDFFQIPFLSGFHGCCGTRTPAVDVVVTSPTQMTATSPVISMVDFRTKDTEVEVYFEPNFPARFKVAVVAAPAPAINTVSPTTVSTNGGELLEIAGANFHRDARVIIGDVYSKSVTFVDSNTLRAIVPPNEGGLVSVSVINPDDQKVTLADGVAFHGLSGISPRKGARDGGTTVTITGFGITAPATVSIGGSPATNVTVVDGTTITATTPLHAPGAVDVSATFGGQTYVLNGAYTYLEYPPTITSLTPNAVAASGGTVIAVRGTNFQSGAEVYFDGIKANTNTFVSATRVNAMAPAHAAGIVDVTIKNPDQQVFNFEQSFTYKGIASIEPAQGSPGAGVTITGGGFVAGATVTFGGTAATNVNVSSSTALTLTVPDRPPAQVDVVVTNPGGEAFTKTNGFRVLAPPPTITGFSPATAYPGDTVTITGTNFISVTGVKFFDNANATFTVDSATQITATVPGPAKTGPITVIADAGSVNSSNITIQNAAAVINSFSPSGGPPGTNVTILGTRMTGATAVTFGGASATSFTVVSNSRIDAVVPSNAVTGPICIVTPGPTVSFTGCSSGPFTMAPKVTSFSPTSGLPGASVTVSGTDLQGATTVRFNGVAASSFTVNGAGTSITTAVPNGASSGPISVTTPFGTATTTSSFVVPPVITSFTPLRAGIGKPVTINGARFTGATSVRFNSVAAAFTISSDTAIQATVPNSATDGPITVTTPSGTATSSESFGVATVPTVTSFSPVSGSPGTAVNIVGLNFLTAIKVTFNGVAAQFTIVSDTSITATVPNNVNNGPISITNLEGTGTSTSIFHLPALISSYAPSSGAPGANITINGNNFLGTTAVKFNSTSASFVVNSQEKITATVPAGATSGPLSVTTPAGSVNSTFSFSVLPAGTPIVTATATGATSVSLVWTGSAGGTYDVRRVTTKSGNFGTGTLARVTGTSYVDSTAVAGTTYLYNIRDVGTGAIGNSDYATTVVFTDDPIVPATTRIKAAHVTEMRTAVSAMRVAAQLQPATWTDPTLTGLRIKAVHITELRTALSQALVSLGRYVEFTDPSLGAGSLIRAAHVREVREAVK